jgi:hypothetical protein
LLLLNWQPSPIGDTVNVSRAGTAADPLTWSVASIGSRPRGERVEGPGGIDQVPGPAGRAADPLTWSVASIGSPAAW